MNVFQFVQESPMHFKERQGGGVLKVVMWTDKQGENITCTHSSEDGQTLQRSQSKTQNKLSSYIPIPTDIIKNSVIKNISWN